MDYKRVPTLHFTNGMSSRKIAATTGEGNQRRKDNILINEPILSGIIAFLIPLSSYHIGRKIGKKQRMIFLVIYSLFILYETVFTRSIGVTRSIEMVPFWSYAQINSVPIRNQVILNIFLFIPFGFLLPWVTKLPFKKTLLIGFLFSILIEATQYIFCLGLCEFDDVFHNTLGTAIGYWYRRGLEHLSQRIQNNYDRFTPHNLIRSRSFGFSPAYPGSSSSYQTSSKAVYSSNRLQGFEKAGIKNETLQNLICLESFSYVNRDYTLEQIYNAFDSSGIPYIPLKGSVLQFLYPEPWMRASFDVDILVHERDLDKAIKALQTKAEMVFDHRAYHDVVMRNAAITLELHFSLKETMDNIDRLLDRVWEYAVPEVGSRYAMTPEYLIFHNVAHMSYHFSHGGLGVRPYIDLYLLRTKTDYDEGKLRELLVKCKIDRFYDYCCKLIDVWFEDDQHDEITSRMERFCFEGGVFGNKENSMAAKKRKHSGLSYFYHRLFEDRKSLEQIYPILRDKPELLIFYQMKRWGKGLTTSRESVKRELELMRNTDRDAVQTYDSLMKSLGL